MVQNLGVGKLENTLSNASTHVCCCSVILWKGSFSHCREARPTWPRDHKWHSGSAQGCQLPWPYQMVKCHVVSRDHIWMRHILGWHSAWTSTSFWPIHVMWFPTFLDLVFHIENKLSCSVFLVSLSLSLFWHDFWLCATESLLKMLRVPYVGMELGLCTKEEPYLLSYLSSPSTFFFWIFYLSFHRYAFFL